MSGRTCLAVTAGLAAGLVAALVLPPAGAAVTAAGPTTRVSVTPSGAEGNGPSEAPAVSGDGRYVVFESRASDLVPGDTNNAADIFVKDRRTGSLTRVSASSSGAQANSQSRDAVISASGRFVAFESAASNLVRLDSNGVVDVFVHDRRTGATTRVSVSSGGAQADGLSGGRSDPSISSDGRFVAFDSQASNLAIDADGDVPDVFVRDRQQRTTTLVSVATGGGQQAGGVSESPSLSGDGRYVAFHSFAQLVEGETTGAADIYVHDRSTSATTLVSTQNANSFDPAISGDGNVVVFASRDDTLVPGDTNNAPDVFVRDLQSGVITRVSVRSNGAQANGSSEDVGISPSISADGRLVSFSSLATNLVRADTNGARDAFVHDRATGTTTRVSVGAGGIQADFSSRRPALSPDGRFVAFQSTATNLVAGDRNRSDDVFVRGLS